MIEKMIRYFIAVLACASLAAVGPQPTQVVLLHFTDHPEEPCTLSYMTEMVYTQYSNYLQTESRGQEWLVGSEIHNFTLPHDSFYYCEIGGDVPGNCNSQLILQDARTLTAPYFEIYDQALTVLYLPALGGGLGGGGVVYTDCFNNAADLPILIHEGGHAQGLMHSGSWSCPGADTGEDFAHVIDSTGGCAWSYYGDPYTPMGFNTTATHYSVWEQDLLGWKRASNIQTAELSATYALIRSDIDTLGVQDIRIPLNPEGTFYYTLEYKQGVGVLVRLKISYPFGPDFTGIVNGVYPDPWNHPLAITSTNPFIDPYHGIQVYLMASNSTYATLNIVTQAGPGGDVPPPRRGRKKNDR